jgi:hypothetical protein
MTKLPRAAPDKLSPTAQAALDSVAATRGEIPLTADDRQMQAAPDAATPPAPKRRGRPPGIKNVKTAKRPAKSGDYGVILGPGLKISKLFSDQEGAFDFIRSLPFKKDRRVRLVIIRTLRVNVSVDLEGADDPA